MIVPDVSVLLHAYNLSSSRHKEISLWWEATLSGRHPVGLVWTALLGFIRIGSNARLMGEPLPVNRIISIAESWIAAPCTQLIWPGSGHADTLFRLLRTAGTAGNLTTDAHIAALAIEYDAEVATTDMDFGRFPGLKWFVPGEISRKNVNR
jgi:toxin-antitoxin system PIN domain toxin